MIFRPYPSSSLLLLSLLRLRARLTVTCHASLSSLPSPPYLSSAITSSCALTFAQSSSPKILASSPPQHICSIFSSDSWSSSPPLIPSASPSRSPHLQLVCCLPTLYLRFALPVSSCSRSPNRCSCNFHSRSCVLRTGTLVKSLTAARSLLHFHAASICTHDSAISLSRSLNL